MSSHYARIEYLTRAIYILSKDQLILFHSAGTLIRIISNAPRDTHNDPSNLHIPLSSLSHPHISQIHSLPPHIHLLLEDAITLLESNAKHPASAAMLQLSRNVEESQLRKHQLLIYLKL